ncbi:hypothetical protein AXG93_557s1010 [Marchantia polymorpha subsp. ruderalis]|uniref:Uncharacterized protein n=1 Tax=Marchantia polymorpha subsp. ruderalis TaxID=1480154 RepID=A0A176VRG2_MARPO|nr:hypothetical protein AXG93_557s1010 [Marchantia polymorpha subsp. ruderalis]
MEVDAGMGGEADQQQGPLPHQQQHQQLPPSISGPRPAPSYRVVSAVIEKKEDGPGPRCGHTLTAVAAVGDEGSPGFIGPRLILFGGATALEGNSHAAGPPASSGAGIRLAGATADVHCYDIHANKWMRDEKQSALSGGLDTNRPDIIHHDFDPKSPLLWIGISTFLAFAPNYRPRHPIFLQAAFK